MTIQPLVDERSTFESDECDFGDTQPRFALGTREIIRPDVVDIADESWAAEQPSHAPLLASIPHAAFVIAPNGQIEEANPRAETLVGCTRTELVGQAIDRIVSGLDGPVTETSALDAGVRFVPASGVRVHHRSGRELPASVVLCPHGRGSVVALVTPQPQHAVIALDGLRESDVADIVHDLRGPLATIALEMCVLDDKLANERDAELRGVIGRVTHNIEFLDRLVQDLLDSCSIAAGELELQRRPTELRTLLAQVIDRSVATRDRQRVFLEATAMVPAVVDELRIQRVVANLLQNALKYAPRLSRIVVRLDAMPGFARISVIDAGPGMTPDEAIYIFDRYRRTSRGRTHEGSGLGLYVSRQIIEAHGGRIGVDSVHGGGSRFFFELPV